MSKELEALEELGKYYYITRRPYVKTFARQSRDFKRVEQALERNEPMKIGYSNVGVPFCPNCQSNYLRNSFSNRNKYCGKCGQKLDWSDEND